MGYAQRVESERNGGAWSSSLVLWFRSEQSKVVTGKIAKVPELADAVERSWDETFQLIDQFCKETNNPLKMVLSRVCAGLKAQIEREGAGAELPTLQVTLSFAVKTLM